ncbi:MAG: D-2-hydroxyacid dehydrogenase [Gemmatimonadota bacterium]|nr:D-2-hydroxyacid dehydrogenase [Gemmatimonadota bacterium]
MSDEPAMTRRAVLDMMDRRPVWAMPDWVPDAIRNALPGAWELVVIEEPTDGSGDGAARVSPRVLEAVGTAEIYFGYGIPPELLEAGPGLRWVHSGAAGVGSSLHETMRARDVVFTNSAGIHAPPMAETVLGMILHFTRGLDFAVANQRRGCWSTDPFYNGSVPPTELSEATVGIVGFGGIGREVARRVAALGAHVVAAKRTPPTSSDGELESVAGGGSVGRRIELVHGATGRDTVLRESDVVVLAAPDTPETRDLIDAEALSRMKAGAVLINVGRGRLVVEEALVDALRTGHLRGAGLDVFRTEPLPEGHPLWSFEQVLVTPHVSAVTPGYWKRETDLILENLRHYIAGSPPEEWANVVDKRAGY